jgi:uncharacterized protein (DUF2249 family)
MVLLAACAARAVKQPQAPPVMVPPLPLIAFEGLRPGQVAGIVTDTALKPLQYARVLLDNGRLNSMTDDTGRFHLDSVPPGRHRLRVLRIGYVDRGDSITVDPDAAVSVVLRLRIRIYQLGQVCLAYVVPAIELRVTTSDHKSVPVGTVMIARDGAYADTAVVREHADYPLPASFATERPGHYSVQIDAPGYRRWRRDVAVPRPPKIPCAHVATQHVDAMLER